MDLLAIRTQVAKKSGRYDLVNPSTFADNGMNFHIEAGQKYLDKLVEVPESYAQIFESLASGEYSLTFQHHCRSIETVFVNNDTDRYQLTKVSLNALKNYYSQTIATIGQDAPCVYALANLRALETTAKTSLGTFANLTWSESDTNYGYRGIIIMPPADENYVVEVSGKFLQKILTNDTDENYWTIEYPHLLIMAALRSIEVFNRNTAGVEDWSRAIMTETNMLDLDVAEEDSAGVNQFEG